MRPKNHNPKVTNLDSQKNKIKVMPFANVANGNTSKVTNLDIQRDKTKVLLL